MEPALKLALASCGLFFLTGLLTGVWKYVCMARSSNAQAPVYVDVCHRAALLYSFACLVLAKFVELSVWSPAVDFWATLALITFFANAVFLYAVHGWLRDTDNQFQQPHVLAVSNCPVCCSGVSCGRWWSPRLAASWCFLRVRLRAYPRPFEFRRLNCGKVS